MAGSDEQLEPSEPPPPPTWRRVVRLPRTLMRELRWFARLRRRSLRWRLRTPGRHRGTLLRRAWHSTDPHYLARTLAALRDLAVVEPPPREPPAPGTEVTLTGELSPGRLASGEVLLGDVSVDDALLDALDLDPRARCRVRITVRVLENEPEIAEARGEDGLSP